MYELITSTEKFLSVIPLLKKYIASEGARLALDVETFSHKKGQVPRPTPNKDGGLNGYIRTIQLGLDPTNPKLPGSGRQFIIDALKIDRDVLVRELKPILEEAIVLGQNLKYEYQFFFMQYGIKLNRMVDVMIFSQVLFAGDKIHHGLGDIYGRMLEPGWFALETGKTFAEYKDFKKRLQEIDWEDGDEFTEEQLIYGADDVKLPFYVLEALFAELDKWRETFEYDFPKGKGIIQVLKLEFSLIPAFALIELRGIKLDTKYHREVVIAYLREKRDEASRKLGFTRIVTVKKSNGLRGKKRIVWTEEVEEQLNLRSWQQLKPRINLLLEEHLGKAEDGSTIEIDSTSEDEIRGIVLKYSEFDEDEPNRPVLPPEVRNKLLWILQFKKASSLLSKFGDKMLELANDTDYIHPGWHQIGTDEMAVDSGRSSCSKPNLMQQPSRGELWVTMRDDKGKRIDGINVMQFFRTSFIAEDGWVLLDADYAQEEPRIAAEYCGEEELIRDYQTHGKNTDIHGIVGKKLMGLPEQPKKGDFNRDYIGKTAGLSLIYGISFKSLKGFMYAKTEGLVRWSEKEAKQAYDLFFEGFPNIKRKMDQVAASVKKLAEDSGFTLAPFKKNRRPFTVAFTMLGRGRRFCLRPDQMRLPDHELGRNFMAVKIDPDTKKPKLDEEGNVILTSWNTYRERLSSASRESFNHGIQGTAADILKFAIVEIHSEFEKVGFDWREGIVAVIHDEVLCHVKEEHKQLAADIIEKAMVNAGKRFLKRVPVEIDLHSGANWASCKK